MRTNYFKWLSALALVILIVSQYVIITETFETKKARIDSKYNSLVKIGLYKFEDLYSGFAMDSLYNAIDEQALQYLISPVDNDTITDDFNTRLNDFDALDLYLLLYLKQSGEDPGFHSAFLIRSLTLIDLDADKIIFIDTAMIIPAYLMDPLLAGSYTIERNYFRMTYDYYISIDHKTGIIMNEMRFTLILALFAILVVFIVFYITLRNMLLQKRLSDLKSDFINNMTHELKTPLSTISVASSSLVNPDHTINNDRIKELSSLIKKQNRHLSDLIDRILDISIWEKDQVKLRKKEIDIETFISDIVDAFSLEYNGKKVDITVDMEINNKSILIDEIHMTTVINNLLLNAMKYCQGKPEIAIIIESNSHLQIIISDNGPGISREEQKHVFEKFYRGDDSKSKVIKGLGLGLYYVKQIVQAHNGEISLQSEPGRGATFEINIPMNHEHSSR